MPSQTFNISMDEELVKKLDEQARREYSSRSDFIRKAVINQLNTEQALTMVFDRANAKGRAQGITSEEQVYDIIKDSQSKR